MAEKERKKTGNISRLVVALLAFALFASTIAYIAIMFMDTIYLQDRIGTAQAEVTSLRQQNSELTGQVNALRARENVFVDALRIMNDDFPTIEVLEALKINMDYFGIGFDTLRFFTVAERNVVEVTGQVASDRQLIDFTNRLRFSRVFSDVFLPQIPKQEFSGMIWFTIRMPVRAIGEIN